MPTYYSPFHITQTNDHYVAAYNYITRSGLDRNQDSYQGRHNLNIQVHLSCGADNDIDNPACDNNGYRVLE
jgi:hypothetical protein